MEKLIINDPNFGVSTQVVRTWEDLASSMMSGLLGVDRRIPIPKGSVLRVLSADENGVTFELVGEREVAGVVQW